jgi:hypothetical protein
MNKSLTRLIQSNPIITNIQRYLSAAPGKGALGGKVGGSKDNYFIFLIKA